MAVCCSLSSLDFLCSRNTGGGDDLGNRVALPRNREAWIPSMEGVL